MSSILEIPAVTPRRTWARARLVLSLFKLRIGTMIAITGLAAMAFVPGRLPSLGEVLALAGALLMSSAAAGGFNQWYERTSDRRMARTRRRAFATGELSAGPVWLLLFAALLLGAVALAAQVNNIAAATYTLLGALCYGGLYTVWLKRRSAWNIVIGGLAGSFAVLAGAAAVDPAVGIQGWLLAAVLFLWTPPHFWSLAIANRDEYAAAGVPMLPVVVGVPRAARIVFASTLALVLVSVLPVAFGAGLLYAIGAGIGGYWFIWRAWRLAVVPNRPNAMAAFFASLTQLSLLLAAATLDRLFL